MTDQRADIEAVAKTFCQSRKFETGQGGCAAICMSVLGDSRRGPHGCPHAPKAHEALATAAIEALRPFHETDRLCEGCGQHMPRYCATCTKDWQS